MQREKTAVSACCLPSSLNVFEGLHQNPKQSGAEHNVLTLPKSCQKCSFQLSRQSCLSQNNIGFSCDKESIAMVMQKKSRLGG